jgi:hypothetical protein
VHISIRCGEGSQDRPRKDMLSLDSENILCRVCMASRWKESDAYVYTWKSTGSRARTANGYVFGHASVWLVHNSRRHDEGIKNMCHVHARQARYHIHIRGQLRMDWHTRLWLLKGWVKRCTHIRESRCTNVRFPGHGETNSSSSKGIGLRTWPWRSSQARGDASAQESFNGKALHKGN